MSIIQDQKYDAFLLVSFGGPENMDEVMPFLENVLRGKNVPRERMLSVAHHYELFGGVSPINAQNRALLAALKPLIEDSDPQLPLYWGNRNWHPMLSDTIKKMADDGVKSALAFVTSAYSSYSSCRQYLENIQQACNTVGERAPNIAKIRAYYNHPGFIEPNVEHLRKALHAIPEANRQRSIIAFTAHSIPLSMAAGCDYEKQLRETSRLVAEQVGIDDRWQLVFQSRSGPPNEPWLAPDICDFIKEQSKKGVKDLIVAPIGFISDHMEILFDLDTEAKQLAQELSINLVRAETVGIHPRFVRMIKELVEERLSNQSFQSTMSLYPARDAFCLGTCCPPYH